MKKLFTLFFLSLFLFLGAAGNFPVFAADVRSGDEVTIPATATTLKDLYLFGGTIRLDAPVQNDVVAAGGNISISKPVTGSAIVAGGNIRLSGPIGNTVRTAGGDISIESTIQRDLVVAGGTVMVTKDAAIGGDILFNGGKFTLDAPVKGKAIINGGEIVINNTINGDVSGEMGKLTLGPNAKINGNLSYKSQEKAHMANGATVRGNTNYTPSPKQNDHAKEFITAGAIYKLITDILLSILFIYFFTRAILAVLARMTRSPAESGAIGFAFIALFPVAAFILFILIWLGIAALLSYALVLLVSLFLVKVFLGWYVLRWWDNREKRTYHLDWKAGIVGPIILFIIAAIPVVGWLAGAILMCIATGALVQELWHLAAPAKADSHRHIEAGKHTAKK
jgi:hypothetical protein